MKKGKSKLKWYTWITSETFGHIQAKNMRNAVIKSVELLLPKNLHKDLPKGDRVGQVFVQLLVKKGKQKYR